jgi:CHAD domain-containing protein
MTMREYARLETASLVQKLANLAAEAAQSPTDEAVHDLRVVIRRLKRCLRVFSQFYPGSSWKKLRNELGELMTAAAAVRDLDIAIGLLLQAGLVARSDAIVRLKAMRATRGRSLARKAKPWKKRLHRWGRKLEL